MDAQFSLRDEAGTLALGAALAAGARNGLVLHLSGDLGAGKTTLVRGLLQALGHQGRVKSPTYTLLEPYTLSRLNFYHFDLYRFKDRSEWLNSGFQEHFGPHALCVVEWPEKAGDAIATPDLAISLAHRDPGRAASLRSHSASGAEWLASASSRLRSS